RFEPEAATADTFNATFETVVHNRHLVWPDSPALGKDGTLYITSAQVNRLPSFNGGVDPRQPPYILYKVKTDATPGTRWGSIVGWAPRLPSRRMVWSNRK